MLKRLFTQSGKWLDDRLGFSDLVGPAAKHLVPRDARWWYVFGSATLAAFAIQVLSGVALAFSYIPSSSQAYATLQFITNEAAFGRFMRGLHYYGASAMVLMVGVHAIQVFLFGSYKYPREMNWITGALLLVFTIVMGFTGQLLRWDQTAVWSVVIAAEQAGRVPLIGEWLAHFIMGGDTVGGATLSRFFAIHVFLIPACIFAFVGIHLLLVLRHGISEPPKPGRPVNPKTYHEEYHQLLKKSGVPFWPDAAWRDATFGVAMIAGIALMAWLAGPPELGKPPDPSIIAAVPRPDWYLLWYYAMFALIPHALEDYFIVLFPVVVGFVMIGLPLLFNKGERSPLRRPWAMASVTFIVIMVGAFWREGLRSPWSPNFNPTPLSAQVVGAASGPVWEGAQVFQEKGCFNCHLIEGDGGRRGPDLSSIADRLNTNDMILRVMNGAPNMPAYSSILKPGELDDLVAFLGSRRRAPPTK